MSTKYLFDNHTLFIKCDCATKDQICSAFRDALTNYQNDNNCSLDCRFRVNLVEDREGNSFGIAFVFVTNPAVYHMLLGKNPDGSDRIEYTNDPSWVAPADGELTNDFGWSSFSDPIYTPGMDWGEISDLEDEYERKLEEERNRHVCPKIPNQLKSLMSLPPFKLTLEQIEAKRSKIITENNDKPDFNVDLVEVSELAYYGVDRAMITPVDPKFMHNILKSKGVPNWVNEKDLKSLFSPYASDSITVQEKFIKGRRVEETYPFVNINNDGVAFIIFDPNTHDAQFALHMMKKTVVTKLIDGFKNTITLIFQHSFRTDRDLMTDINHQPRPIQHRDDTNSKSPRSKRNNYHSSNGDKSNSPHGGHTPINGRKNKSNISLSSDKLNISSEKRGNQVLYSSSDQQSIRSTKSQQFSKSQSGASLKEFDESDISGNKRRSSTNEIRKSPKQNKRNSPNNGRNSISSNRQICRSPSPMNSKSSFSDKQNNKSHSPEYSEKRVRNNRSPSPEKQSKRSNGLENINSKNLYEILDKSE